MNIPPLINKKWFHKTIWLVIKKFSRTSYHDNTFSKLVLERKSQLWSKSKSNMKHDMDDCENTLLSANNTILEWKCCDLWHRKLSNKINSKFFAQMHGVNVPKLLWTGSKVMEIPYDKLPNKYVIKLANGWSSQHVLPVNRNINLFTGEPISNLEISSFFEPYLKNKNILLIEELIESNEILPKDYKVYCFHGKPYFIQVIDRINCTHIWYDKDWKKLDDQILISRNTGLLIEKPRALPELINSASVLSKAYNFNFIRVDFFVEDDKIYFVEFSHTPNTGASNKLYTPYADQLFGILWKMN